MPFASLDPFFSLLPPRRGGRRKKPSAESELTNLWIDAPDRQAVADAANRIDQFLGANPHRQGESREQQTRILFERPLAAQFEILPDASGDSSPVAA